jgi:hypothetical protein
MSDNGRRTLLTTVINDKTYLPGMVVRTARRTPDTTNTKLTAPAGFVIPRTIHLPPAMRTTRLDPPALTLRITQCCFNILIRVQTPLHKNLLAILSKKLSCDNMELKSNLLALSVSSRRYFGQQRIQE